MSGICLAFYAQGQINNRDVKPSIKTAFIAIQSPQQSIVTHPVFSLTNQERIALQFDDLNLRASNYILRVIHCQFDWTPSPLSEIEYLQDFNDIPIRNPYASAGTKVPYLHYQIPLPRVRKSGNYIAMVYANRNKRDTVLTRRFSVYEAEITVAAAISFPRGNTIRNSHQALDIQLVYPAGFMVESADQFKIWVQKNAEPNNAYPIMPNPMINGADRRITYPAYVQENTIVGGDEYRMIDLRSNQQKLSFVDHIQQSEQMTEISTQLETPQANFPYIQRNDLNGAFIIGNYENPSNDAFADYVACTFYLKSRNIAPNDVFIKGGFNQYIEKDSLVYDPVKQVYTSTILLKQGIYNYRFDTKNPSNNIFEGNHAQTENQYTVLVYMRKPGTRYDAIVGYQKISSIR